MKKIKIFGNLLFVLGLISISIGVTFAFFNYTRTGSVNTVKTGRISLKTIYVSSRWNIANTISSSSVFSGCTSLVGGNGTVYDSSKIGGTMAVIDTPSTPGYLTLKTI